LATTRPARVITSGFVALDVVLDTASRAAAGGTAANVAVALRSFGWDASIVGTLGDDPAGRFICQDLVAAGLDTSKLQLDESWNTPVVLQESRGGDHAWRFICPQCGTRFAKHRPSRPEVAAAIIDSVAPPDVFFFDRASLFTLKLAVAWRAAGSLVVFEPASLGRPLLFERAVSAADIVKYSAQRATSVEDAARGAPGALVRTLGPDGLEFRVMRGTRWHHVPVVPVANVVDSAGAGDWTTAGLVDVLRRDFGTSVRQALVRTEALALALSAAQRWGARACQWRGARPDATVKTSPAQSHLKVVPDVNNLVCAKSG